MMSTTQTYHTLVTPCSLLNDYPLTPIAQKTVANSRLAVRRILGGKDQRLLVIVGPCSIHDEHVALAYAEKLKQAAMLYQKELLLVMRTYVEKPRTTLGWKGYLYDPHLDGSHDINMGLSLSRQLLLAINELGVPTATEFVNITTPHYLSDLICWGAIGARTSGSQLHRELASGLAMPIGFKNSLDGNVKIAIEAVQTARHKHDYLGVNHQGVPAMVKTQGNPDSHLVLRGSLHAPNYTQHHVEETTQELIAMGLQPRVMVDCSHGNSMKDNQRQRIAALAVNEQIRNGSHDICGVMLESNLVAGNQVLVKKSDLTYGQSITDACISWDETQFLLNEFAKAVEERRIKRISDIHGR